MYSTPVRNGASDREKNPASSPAAALRAQGRVKSSALAFPVVEAIEGDLAAYYDQEVADRAVRKLDRQRVQARKGFVDSLGDLAGLTVLEIGAGAGLDAAALIANGARVFGVDLSLEQARRQSVVAGLSPVVGSVSRLPVTSKAVDVVWTMSVLMHIPNAHIASVLGEVRRVLRPGGLAVIGVWGGADIEEPRLEDPYRPARLFSRRSDTHWRALLSTIGRVATYETWTAPGGWDYQWAIIQRTDTT
jgi:SAM-dependent methyltransferase